MDRKKTFFALRFTLLASIFVCIYGIAQHFGIDKDIWVQDVQNRIFSALGQPNWLAAWIVAIMPLTWELAINSKQKSIIKAAWLGLSGLLFITLLFTKSRSGILAFTVESVIFWVLLGIWWTRNKLKLFNFFLVVLPFALLLFTSLLIIGSPWTPSILSNPSQTSHQSSVISETSLETGGTESGEIRKIVWGGAFDIWKHYPIFGTGVETFAFSYYTFKPLAHNYTSEWDYIYNKAHNEYLNYLATTGVVGFISYIALITMSIIVMVKGKSQKNTFHFALLAGYISILITNFFGFSVVPVSLLFFLFPAFAIALNEEKSVNYEQRKINLPQKIGVFFVFCLLLVVSFAIGKYWYSDTLYTKGRRANDEGNYALAHQTLTSAIANSPNEAIFWDELAQNDRDIAVSLSEMKKNQEAEQFAQNAVDDSSHALELSPSNVNLKRSRAILLTKLSGVDPNYLLEAHTVLLEAVKLAPTDPKLQYTLSSSFYRLGELDRAIDEMKKAVAMKTDYKDSHYALALMYEDKKDFNRAKEELNYILEHIDPKDETVKKDLEELRGR